MRRARASLESVLGSSAPLSDPGFVPHTGFTGETDDGRVFALLVRDADGNAWSVIAQSVGDLPAIASAIGLADREIVWRAKTDPTRPWAVIRIDDNGNRTVQQRAMVASEAKRACEYWSRRGAEHKQTWVVERAG